MKNLLMCLIKNLMMRTKTKEQVTNFYKEYIELCKKYGLCIEPEVVYSPLNVEPIYTDIEFKMYCDDLKEWFFSEFQEDEDEN